MQKLLNTVILICLITAISCNSKPPKEKANFMDVAAYLKGQLAYLDTVPLALLKTTLKDTVYSDSVFIKKEELRSLVDAYLVSQLEKEAFENSFEETSFMDATINTITLTYQAIDKELPLQRIDVYVDPETQEIKRMYLVRQEQKKDTSLSQQLLWKHNSSCTIITSQQLKGQETITNEKIAWNE
jgi:hypothetical protein